MERWAQYAFFSMVFAGFTSVIAKLGLAGISADLGLAIRTCFVFVFVLMFAGVVVPSGQWQTLSTRNFLWLALSGVTTALSWVFYYRAIKLCGSGPVASSATASPCGLRRVIPARLGPSNCSACLSLRMRSVRST